MFLQNPFEDPRGVDKEKNEEIILWINNKINSGSFSFHDMLQKLEEYVEKKEEMYSLILAHYTTNVILKNKNLSEQTKFQLITDIQEMLNIFQTF